MSHYRASVSRESVILTDSRLGGIRGKWCPTIVFSGERVSDWYASEPTHRDETDIADALMSASRYSLSVSHDRVKSIYVSTGNAIEIDTRELVAEIDFNGLHFFNPDSPGEVFTAPVFRHREACRRVYKWARALGSDALRAFTFDGFHEAICSLLNLAPQHNREIPRDEYDASLDDALLGDPWPDFDTDCVPF